jgi:hypothetical protein
MTQIQKTNTAIQVQREDLISQTQFGISKGKEIARAIYGPKIRDIDPGDDEPIKQVFRYIFTLIGLKAENIPDDIQKAVLLNFIRTDLAQYGVEEFRIAFHLLVKNELDMEPQHFQNFNPLYLAQVMAAYDDHRKQVFKKLREAEAENEKPKEMTPEEKYEAHEGFVNGTILFAWDYFIKTGTLTFGICPWGIIYKCLTEEIGLFNVPSEEKNEIWKLAMTQVEQEVNKKKGTARDMKEFRALADIIKKIETDGLEKSMKHQIISKAQEISIKRYFQQFKDSGFDFHAAIKNHLENHKFTI